MSEKRPDEPWLDEEPEPTPTPWWKSQRAMWTAIGIVGVIAFLFSQGHQQQRPDDQTKAAAIGVVVPFTPPAPDPPAPPPAPPLPVPPPAPKILATTAAAAPTPNLRPGTAPKIELSMTSYPIPQRQPAAATTTPATDPAHTSIKFEATTIPGTKASPAIDETYLLNPGLLVCVLDNAIDSNLPGPLFCHLPGPVYSPKGVVLMEAETAVMGRYESLTSNGSKRLQAISVFAHTPNGVWASLVDSPMADDLGRTGLSANIDNRYFERFGGAVLLDLAGSALQILQASVAKGGNTYLSFNSTDSLASQILREQVNKPPIGTKNPGELIAIALTRPIDFGDSYRVKVR